MLLTYARAVNHAIYDAFLDELEEAGYRFRAIQVIAGQHPRDLLVPVSRDEGIVLAPPSFKQIDDAGTLGHHAPARPGADDARPRDRVARRSAPRALAHARRRARGGLEPQRRAGAVRELQAAS